MKRTVLLLFPLVLSGCTLLGTTQSDASAFCTAAGQARTGDIYHVTGNQDFWLTPSGQYLSDRELSAPQSTIDALQNTLQGQTDPRKNAVKVRIFRVASRDDTRVNCLTVKYDAADKAHKFATLKTGQRIRVVADNYGKSGSETYLTRSSDGFSYQLIK